MKAKNTFSINGVEFSVRYQRGFEGNKIAYVYKKGESKLPLVGTTFSPSASFENDIMIWAKKCVLNNFSHLVNIGDKFEVGEIVWDSGNNRYGVILDNTNYDGDIRLDSDGMQPMNNLHRLGSHLDKGTKEQLIECLMCHKTLVTEYEYPTVNY